LQGDGTWAAPAELLPGRERRNNFATVSERWIELAVSF